MMCRPRFESMLILATWLAASLAAFFFPTSILAQSTAAPDSTVDWLKGDQDNLQIRIRGTVVDLNGNPVEDAKMLVLQKQGMVVSEELAVTQSGNKFEFWIALSRMRNFVIKLRVESQDGTARFARFYYGSSLRQLASEGLDVILRPTERTLSVKVKREGKVVAGAWVKVGLSDSFSYVEQTDRDGTARFPTFQASRVNEVAAWHSKGESSEHFFGGYNLYRDPPFSPTGDEFEVDLQPSEPRKFRIVDQHNNAVPNLKFHVESLECGHNPHMLLTTDANGYAATPWLPKEQGTRFYFEVHQWYSVAEDKLENQDGVWNKKVTKYDNDSRRWVTGKLEVGDANLTSQDLAGVSVEFFSFQSEREYHSDRVSCFANANEEFRAKLLPGATYIVSVNDRQFVSKTFDKVLVEADSDIAAKQNVKVYQGQAIEISIKESKGQRPLPFEKILIGNEYDFEWLENDEKRYGSSGRKQWLLSDENGIARARGFPGEKIRVTYFSPEWRFQETIEVAEGTNRISIIRPAGNRKIVGQLKLSPGLNADLAKAKVTVGSIDGQTNERQTIETDEMGRFEFTSSAAKIGLFATTSDGKAAGQVRVSVNQKTCELILKPTSAFHGQLLGVKQNAIANCKLTAKLTISGKGQSPSLFSASFVATEYSTTTNEKGLYTFANLPVECPFTIMAETQDSPGLGGYVGKFYLTPNEVRPPTVSHLWHNPKPRKAIPLSDQYASMLRDCRLGGYHMMVIAHHDDETTNRFVKKNLVSYDLTPEVAKFMQFLIKLPSQDSQTQQQLSDEDLRFAEEKTRTLPKPGRVLAIAIDASGKEIGRLNLDPTKRTAAILSKSFLRNFAPKSKDPQKAWAAAFELAKKTDRKVWVRLSGRYCGPCFRLTRWIDDHREILAKDYVLLKVDERNEDTNSILQVGRGDGIPFHGILDADENLLINARSPLGNIGFPSSWEGTQHLKKMLMKGRKHLTTEDIERLVESLRK